MTGFGSNPGELQMFVYEPPKRLAAGAPLIVVMHGCGQDAASFAADAGWIGLAREIGAALLLPGQSRTNSRGRCFNWFRPADTRRGSGEAMSIRQMVRKAIARFGSDPRRVFIVGLSAGGAMAAALLAAYPAVFAAGAVVAGMPVGAANNGALALLRLYRAERYRGRAALAVAVRASAPPRPTRPWPRLSIWHGDGDRVIDPANAELLAAQWSAVHGCEESPTVETCPTTGVRHRVWENARGAAVECWTIADLGHGIPIDSRVEGGGRAAFAVIDVGLSAADQIARFWGLKVDQSQNPLIR